MSQNFFDKQIKGFSGAYKNLSFKSVYSAQQFKDIYQAMLGSVLIIGSGVALAMALSFITPILSMLLASLAFLIVLANLLGLSGKMLSAHHSLSFAVLLTASALLTPVFPYVAIALSMLGAVYKCQTLVSDMLETDQMRTGFSLF